ITTIEEYLQKTELKTASLFESMIDGLFLLLNLDNFLKDFGTNYGTAFQIKNDLDDYKQGLLNSKDIKNKIYTAPIIFLNEVKFDNNAIEKTSILIDNCSRRAIMALENLRDSEYKTSLIGEIKCLMK
ncbi:MAG: polyprenyl synthetase family protein, partial [Candidatus Gastranaerophilales bacterium]|nr:polyprenyl synthetase family protein [Candidatus Gastranaerophilales bacterium]